MKTRLGLHFAATCLFAASAAAQTLDVVHRFQQDGGAYGRLIQGTDGNFYGTTSWGGLSGVGTIFRMDSSGVVTTIHSFGYAEGTSPKAALLQGADGSFYGTTSGGGTGNEGTVFKMDATGNVTTLHNFDFQDGAAPSAPLIQTADGSFYGTTVSGGTGGCPLINSCGTVFRMDASGNVTTLHSFTGADGSHPSAALLAAADGNFFGTTSSGGASGWGTVFKMDPAGSVTTVHAFVSSSGGSPTAPLVQDADGNLYGTTHSHLLGFPTHIIYGNVFRITLPSAFSVVHTFTAEEGLGSSGGLVLTSDGLYGTTAGGNGRVFQLSLAGTLATLYSFTGPDGSIPYAGLVQATDGNLYGATLQGGTGGVGTVFKLDTSNRLTTLYNFQTEGLSPQASLIQAPDGAFYGTTSNGGAGGVGTVFKTDSTGNITTLHSFAHTDGAYPDAALLRAADGNFYGTTSGGGSSPGAPYGTVFKMDSAGGVTTLHSFDQTDGEEPQAALIRAADGNFYGTTVGGGTAGGGTIFKIDSTGNLTPMHSFNGSDGASPFAPLIQAFDGNFYGTTLDGVLGGPDYGTVFKMDSSGTVTTLHSFDGSDGASSFAALIQASDGNFYGITSSGGTGGYGSVFKMDSTGNLTTLHSFDAADGAYPSALVSSGDGSFYGTTAGQGVGAFPFGTVFKLDSSSNLTTLHSFHSADGASPVGITLAADGTLWGTTSAGGLETGGGTVFRLILVAASLDVTGISPASGPSSGGTPVNIAGTGFDAGARVMIGDSPANAVSVESSSVVGALSPSLSPGTLNDVTVINVNASFGTGKKLWFADFLDVPQGDIFHDDVETIFRQGITAGLGNGEYGRDNPTTRAQMAVFLLKAEHDSAYLPPTCTGAFPDVPCPSLFADWIEQLATEGVTVGCGGGLYCPDSSVTRRQMAVFLLKAKQGSGYTPPPATGIFGDVPRGDTYAPWIEELYNRQITGGCQASPLLYCPDNPSTRGQMAAFLAHTFGFLD